MNASRHLAAFAFALILPSSAVGETDQSTPEKAMESLFAAAKTGDFAAAASLIPDVNPLDSELGVIKRLPASAPGVQAKFQQWFGTGTLDGAARVTDEFATQAFRFGPEDATEEQSMRLKKIDQKWFPYSLPGTGFFDDADKYTPAAPEASDGPVAVDQSTPEKTLETLFAAAAADDFEAVKSLVPEKGLPSADIRKMGNLNEESDGVRGKFKKWFTWGKVAEPAKVEEDGKSAWVQIRFGEGGKESESMQLKLVDGKWYLHRLFDVRFFADTDGYAEFAPEIAPPPVVPAGEVTVDQSTPLKAIETLLAAAKAKNYAVVESLVQEEPKGSTLAKMAALSSATDEEKASFHAWFDPAEVVGEPQGSKTAIVRLRGGEETGTKTIWLKQAEDGRYLLYSFSARVF